MPATMLALSGLKATQVTDPRLAAFRTVSRLRCAISVGGACGRSGSGCLLVLLTEVLRDGLVEGTEKPLQGAHLRAEGMASFAGDLDPGAWPSFAGGLVLADEAGFLQGLKVPAQVAVRDPERGLEVGEVCFRHPVERREDPESHALVHVVVEVMDGVLAHRLIISETTSSTVA
jgi:hypothetical protein